MNRVYKTDTITAVSSGLGGGIAVVRISGDESFDIINECFRMGKDKNIKLENYESHKAYYGFIVDIKGIEEIEDSKGNKESKENKDLKESKDLKGNKDLKDLKENIEVIDEVLILPMEAPRTYTREDVLEIHCHGGVKSVQRLMELIISKGIRHAEAGEFTKRAFLNGRLDLSQAEAVADLISAKTELSRKTALNQLSGTLSNKINNLRESVILMIANIEANIDYPENDIEELSMININDEVSNLKIELNHLLKTADNGKIIREGVNTVILGTPNVGKSSLLNALMKEDRAIVTSIAGTTRDVLKEFITIGNVPIKIMDTAGIRETDDEIEKIGVELSRKYAEIADLILLVIDGSKPLNQFSIDLIKLYKDNNLIIIINKSDLENLVDLSEIATLVNENKIVHMSAKGNIGVDKLEKLINDMFLNDELNFENNDLIINARHKGSIINAITSLSNVEETVSLGLTQEFIALDLTDCYNSLGEIIGKSLNEDIIARIFSEFCLGK